MKKKSLFAFRSKRPIHYLLVFGVIPTFILFYILVYHYLSEESFFMSVENQIERVHLTAELKEKKQSLNNCVRNYFCAADHYYIDQELETLTLLNQEREALEKLISSSTFTGNAAIETRYGFLTSETNRLLFNEGSMQSGEGFQETVEILSHPVEVTAEDLQEILSKIERKKEGQPQLIITDFKLEKKKSGLGNEAFGLNMKLLKREFLES